MIWSRQCGQWHPNQPDGPRLPQTLLSEASRAKVQNSHSFEAPKNNNKLGVIMMTQISSNANNVLDGTSPLPQIRPTNATHINAQSYTLSSSTHLLEAMREWAHHRKPLVVVVDEQYPGQVDQKVLTYQKDVLMAAHEHNIPTLFLNNKPESPISELMTLAPDAPQLLKNYHNGFQTQHPLNAIFKQSSFPGQNQCSGLEQHLKETERDLLILTGFDGLICVAHTAGITYAERANNNPNESDDNRLALGVTKGALQLGYDVAISPAGLNTQSTREKLI